MEGWADSLFKGDSVSCRLRCAGVGFFGRFAPIRLVVACGELLYSHPPKSPEVLWKESLLFIRQLAPLNLSYKKFRERACIRLPRVASSR